jgi:hypothetical protein
MMNAKHVFSTFSFISLAPVSTPFAWHLEASNQVKPDIASKSQDIQMQATAFELHQFGYLGYIVDLHKSGTISASKNKLVDCECLSLFLFSPVWICRWLYRICNMFSDPCDIAMH